MLKEAEGFMKPPVVRAVDVDTTGKRFVVGRLSSKFLRVLICSTMTYFIKSFYICCGVWCNLLHIYLIGAIVCHFLFFNKLRIDSG